MSAPTVLNVVSQSASAVALAWTPPTPTPTSYTVYRAQAAALGSWAAPAVIGTPSTPSFTDSTGAIGVTYLYQVTATLAGVESGHSNGVSASFVTAEAQVSGVGQQQIAVLFVGPHVKTAAYTRFGFAPVNIPVIYGADNKSLSAHDGDVNSSFPEVICKTSDVAQCTNKDSMVIEGVTFFVREVGNDGTGLTVLRLSLDNGQ